MVFHPKTLEEVRDGTKPFSSLNGLLSVEDGQGGAEAFRRERHRVFEQVSRWKHSLEQPSAVAFHILVLLRRKALEMET